MKAVVIGLGSMGKRRIRHMQSLNSSMDVIGVDSSEVARESARDELGIDVVSSLEHALKSGVDCAFVCTSPLSHASIVRSLAELSIPTFTELNLVSNGYEYFESREKECKLFLSSTFLYRKDVQYIIDSVSGKNVNYVYHSGQYLPDWHPWEDYRKSFFSSKRTNGCREILAIELPWLCQAFGSIERICCKRNTTTSLELEYSDSYSILLEHEGGTCGLLAVDVASRQATRRFEAYGEALSIRWGGRPDSLYEFDIEGKSERRVKSYSGFDHDERYSPNIIEDAYRDEVEAFLKWVLDDDDSSVLYSYEKDRLILTAIDRIETL